MNEAVIIESLDRFCVYGVATDYDGMIELVRYRLEELNTTHESVDDVSGLHGGYTSKLVAPKPIKSMGKTSMGPMLQTLGLALIVVRDDIHFEKIRHRLTKRERPRQLPAGSSTRNRTLITKGTTLKMQALRNDRLSERERVTIARKAGKASGKARRRKAKMQARQRRQAHKVRKG